MKWARGRKIFLFLRSFPYSNFLFLYLGLAFCFFIFFPIKEIVNVFQFKEDTFSDGKQNVAAQKNTLMPVSDGLGPSIFFRNLEKNESREGIEGWKICLFPARVSILTLMLWFIKVLFRISFLSWRVNTYVSRQIKGIKKRNESTNY